MLAAIVGGIDKLPHTIQRNVAKTIFGVCRSLHPLPVRRDESQHVASLCSTHIWRDFPTRCFAPLPFEANYKRSR